MFVDAGTRSLKEIRTGYISAFDHDHEFLSTKGQSKVQEGVREFCGQATLKSDLGLENGSFVSRVLHL